MIDEEIIAGVFQAADDDYIDMTDIIYFVRHQADDESGRLRIVATVAEEMVLSGKIVPGRLTHDGFAPWPTLAQESAARIVAESEDLAERGDPVYFGTIAWFDLPVDIAARATDRIAAESQDGSGRDR